MGGRGSYTIDVDDSQADAKINQLEQKMRKAADGAGGLDERTQRLNKSLGKHADAVGGSATALSGLNTAMGGSISGASDMVGAIDNVVSMIRGGGPMAIGITAAVTGLGLLIGKWWEARQAAKKAAEEQVEAARSLAKQIREAASDAERDAARLRLSNVGIEVTDLQARAGQEQKKLFRLEERARELQGQIALQGQRQEGVGGFGSAAAALSTTGKTVEQLSKELKQAEADWDAQLAVVNEIDAAMVNYNRNLDELRSAEKRQKEIQEEAARVEKERLKSIKAVNGGLSDRERELANQIRVEVRAQKFMEETLAKQAKARADALKSEADAEEKARKEREKKEREHRRKLSQEFDEETKRRVAIAKEYNAAQEQATAQLMSTITGTAEGILNVASSQMFSVFDKLREGEKIVAEQIVADFSRMVGEQLVAIGIRSMFEGGAKLFNPATVPVGASEIAFGTLAVSAGLGLGAIASGIPAPPQQSGLGAGGVNRGSSGGSSGGGGASNTNVTLVYGVPPHPEHAYRTVEAIQRQGRRYVGDGRRRGRRG